jgi:thiol:disulfide interchange protein DsbC
MGMTTMVTAAEFIAPPTPNEMGQIESLKKLPISGLSWVKVGGKNMLISSNGKIAIMGNFKIMDVWSRTEVANIDDVGLLNRLRLDKLNLDFEQMASIGLGNPNGQQVTIFVDPLCPYCSKLMQQVDTLFADYKVEITLVPMVSKDSGPIARQLSCLIDEGKHDEAFNILKNKDWNSLPSQKCEAMPLQKSYLAARLIGVKNVPFIIAPNGEPTKGAIKNLRTFIDNNNS